MKAVREWLLQNGTTEDDLGDEEGFLWEFAYWLEQERAIRVSDGLVHFYKLWDDAARLIGDNPVILYHFTAAKNVAAIRRDGLEGHHPSVNRRSTDGVFLTTETSGPAIEGYKRNAARGGGAVCVAVRTTLGELQPDPDDADITSGQTQFVADDVAPSQIVSIEATY